MKHILLLVIAVFVVQLVAAQDLDKTIATIPSL